MTSADAASLYAIIDTEVCHARRVDPLAVTDAYLRGGATLLQLRDKSSASGPFVDLANRMVSMAHEHSAKVIINDRADIALISGADGVHVGQEDLSVADVRTLVGPSALVGLSTHTPEQIARALATDASYVAVGPIFGTQTKATGYDARGLDLVVAAAGRGKPVVAIGGITLANAASVISAGASAVAVITDLLPSGDLDEISRRVRAFVSTLPALPFKV